ncbi:hypothetical protein M426DRAFT_321099 [Hypoxylon sp. CI-4A]|nr:hypothetical protein M426DRAFT_321099 [Hypoxylon sp. CI-4A]
MSFNSFLISRSSSSDYQSSYSRTRKAITTGWIVGIVIICLSFIVAVALTTYVFVRNKRRRQQRMAGFDETGEPKYNNNNNNGAPVTGYQFAPPQSPAYPPATHQQQQQQPNELVGRELPPKYEATDASSQARELPNSEVSYQPVRHEADSVQRSELQ